MAIANNPHLDISKWENVGLLVLDKMDNYDKKFDKLIEVNEDTLGTVNKIELRLERHATKMLMYDIALGVLLVIFSIIAYKEYLSGS
jgi:hypothetical protein